MVKPLQIQLVWISSVCLQINWFVPIGTYSTLTVIMQGHNMWWETRKVQLERGLKRPEMLKWLPGF